MQVINKISCVVALIIFTFDFCFSQCEDYEVELWGLCYSIETTTTIQFLDDTYGIIPDEICNLVNLEILNLTVIWGNLNSVTGEIPACMGNLENLSYLDL